MRRKTLGKSDLVMQRPFEYVYSFRERESREKSEDVDPPLLMSMKIFSDDEL
jgi:hypothetical protein